MGYSEENLSTAISKIESERGQSSLIGKQKNSQYLHDSMAASTRIIKEQKDPGVSAQQEQCRCGDNSSSYQKPEGVQNRRLAGGELTRYITYNFHSSRSRQTIPGPVDVMENTSFCILKYCNHRNPSLVS